MRVQRPFWVGAAILAQGCAVPATLLLDESVGPRDLSGSKTGSGTLVVYTKMEPFNGDPDTPVRQAYVIQPADGARDIAVSNRARLGTDPVPVNLSAGRYRVIAEGPLYRTLSVPVVIQPRDQTVVDLTGEVFSRRLNTGSGWVRLPSGEVVGPKAQVD